MVDLAVVAGSIWGGVKDSIYDWRITSSARERLLEIMPNAASAFGGGNSDLNSLLREIVAPVLRGADRERRLLICKWVVSDWGGIRGNAHTRLEAYSDGLGDGTLSCANTFARLRGIDGVSSWSKVLAFAHPSHHAVYDSRTAFTLNILLRAEGSPYRFWMPATQNRQVGNAVRALQIEHKNGAWLGYQEYLATLAAMVQAGAPSILRAEMALFASAPKLAGSALNHPL